jgi:cell filamentation protein
MPDRYDTTGASEGQCEPGSNDSVLCNKVGITDPDLMDDTEFALLSDFQNALLCDVEIDQRITAEDLRAWHRRWLGPVYEWAGEFRNVNMAKGEFLFAAAHLVPRLMTDFERQYLSRYTPCNGMDPDALIEALAVCHIELIIIHPFREGNGRLARILATVMALQANMPPLDFGLLEEEKARYIGAIHAGHAGDDAPMKRIFSEVLRRTLAQTARNEPSGSE